MINFYFKLGCDENTFSTFFDLKSIYIYNRDFCVIKYHQTSISHPLRNPFPCWIRTRGLITTSQARLTNQPLRPNSHHSSLVHEANFKSKALNDTYSTGLSNRRPRFAAYWQKCWTKCFQNNGLISDNIRIPHCSFVVIFDHQAV